MASIRSTSTSETQELPSLAQRPVESEVLLLISPEPQLEEALLVASALGFQAERFDPQRTSAPSESDRPCVVVISPDSWQALSPAAQVEIDLRPEIAIILASEPDAKPDNLPEDRLFGYLPPPIRTRALMRLVKSAARSLVEAKRARTIEAELIHRTRELRELNAIGTALSHERDHDKLLALILGKARELAGCDAGSLYLLEAHEEQERLVFHVAQNDSIDFQQSAPFPLELSRESLAGFVVLTGQVLRIDDAYHLPEGVEYTIDRSYDERHGYRTKSVLVVPMTNLKGERLGALQLINRRRTRSVEKLTSSNVDREVIPFSSTTTDLVVSLAGQAAICIENNQLYGEVRKLFEGFVSASVTAIEQRDPTTSGHSFRVATLTTRLADMAVRCDQQCFKDLHFTPDQMKELRYAALLHDFGKVGVREEVLVKGKKLYPAHLDLIKERFAYIKKWIEAEGFRLMFETLRKTGPEEMAAIESRLRELRGRMSSELESVDEALATLLVSNEPTVLPEGNFEAIARLGSRTYHDARGLQRPFLTENEVRLLSIRKGSLDEGERLQIESHVTQTFEFLSQIPWTREFQRVPEIAYAHHEKLSGVGYPRRLTAGLIPIESRMMTVADIYDALTAADRPYKKAVPVPRALSIIENEMKDGMLDPDLVRLFIEARVYEATRDAAGAGSIG